MSWKNGRIPAFLLAAGLLVAGCGRVHVGTEVYPLEGGTVTIETYDDPFDNLKSYRIYWQGGGDEREVVDELWGTGHYRDVHQPTLIHEEPLTLGFGQVRYRKLDDGGWGAIHSRRVP